MCALRDGCVGHVGTNLAVYGLNPHGLACRDIEMFQNKIGNVVG